MIYRLQQFLRYYQRACTLYQLHSPFVFGLARAVLEDRRWYYAFDDIERLRGQMLASDVPIEHTDYGSGAAAPGTMRSTTVRDLARRSASGPRQGRRLFRLAQWLGARRILELGTSIGVGTLYLGAADRRAQLVSLEGCPACANVARVHLDYLGLHHAEVTTGEFEATLGPALQRLGPPDLVFFDGNHRGEPTLRYFETCLAHAHEHTAFVFDDVHATPDMHAAWRRIQEHPAVTLTIDCFDLALAFVQKDVRVRQHFTIAPRRLKPWKVF